MTETDRQIDYDLPKPARPKPVSPGHWVALYKPEYAEIASRLSAVGFNSDDVAHTLGVDPKAIANWKIHFPVFKEAVTDGRHDQLRRMAGKALLEAVGYDYQTTKTEVTENPDGSIKSTKRTVFTNHQSPQPNLLIFLLCNLSSQLGLENESAWKSRQKLEIESKSINLTITGELVSEQITRLAGKLLGHDKPSVIEATFEPVVAQDKLQDANGPQGGPQSESQDSEDKVIVHAPGIERKGKP